MALCRVVAYGGEPARAPIVQDHPAADHGRRAHLDGYAVGVEFLRLASSDRGRLVELFPGDPSLSWGSEDLPGSMPSDPPSSPPAH